MAEKRAFFGFFRGISAWKIAFDAPGEASAPFQPEKRAEPLIARSFRSFWMLRFRQFHQFFDGFGNGD